VTTALIGHAVRTKDGSMLPGVIDGARQNVDAVAQLNAYFKKDAPHEAVEVVKPGTAAKADAFDKLRDLVGYVENGSFDTVTLSMDDATRTIHARVDNRHYWANSLIELIDKATKGEAS
jgi:hypothetical protein